MNSLASRKGLWISAALLAVLVAITGFMYATNKPALTGSVLNPPWLAPEIKLTDHNGAAFTLSALRGKVVLLYFGYTNCPDECPLTMAHMKLVTESLGDQAARVQVAMVSTDPARDTPAALAHFMTAFEPTFLGITGTPAALAQTWQDYGVHVENAGETHSTYIYVIDPKGYVRETFLPDSTVPDIAGDVRALLKGD